MGKFLQGKYKPANPEKYKGNPTNIVYRSSWELKLLTFLDKNENIIQYSSEEFFVPYRNPIDNKIHRYFPDFWIKQKNKQGLIEELIVEIKPKSQTQVPKRAPKKRESTYIREALTYGKNLAKWKAAEEYAKKRGWKFQIMTEEHLYNV